MYQEGVFSGRTHTHTDGRTDGSLHYRVGFGHCGGATYNKYPDISSGTEEGSAPTHVYDSHIVNKVKAENGLVDKMKLENTLLE